MPRHQDVLLWVVYLALGHTDRLLSEPKLETEKSEASLAPLQLTQGGLVLVEEPRDLSLHLIPVTDGDPFKAQV